MMISTIDPRQSLTKVLQLIIFLSCLTFVVHRGYKCFQKYLAKPEGADINFHFAGKQPFPSFTFCKHLSSDVLRKCNLTSIQYDVKGIWTGHGSPECTNAKALKEKVTGSFRELDVNGIMIFSFDNYFFGEIFMLDQLGNHTFFEWESSLNSFSGSCHTLTFKSAILDHGIEQVLLFHYELKQNTIFIHFCIR